MNDLPAPPERTVVIGCPACGHPINGHEADPCIEAGCSCHWTPNDIAYYLLFGSLTPPATPRSVTRQPDGKWVENR